MELKAGVSSFPKESLLPAKELLALNDGFDGNAVRSDFLSTTGASAPKSGNSTFVNPKVGASGLDEFDERPSSANRARRCMSTFVPSIAFSPSSGKEAPMSSALSLLVETDDLLLWEDERESGGDGMDEDDG